MYVCVCVCVHSPGKDLGVELNTGFGPSPTTHHVCDILPATLLP